MLWFWSEKWAKIRAKMSSFRGWFFSNNIDDIAVFRKLYKRKRLSLANKKGFELSLFLVY